MITSKTNPKEIIFALLEHWKLMVFLPAMVGTATVIIVFSLPPTYESQAVVSLSADNRWVLLSDEFLGAALNKIDPADRSEKELNVAISDLRRRAEFKVATVDTDTIIILRQDVPDRSTLILNELLERLATSPLPSDPKMERLQNRSLLIKTTMARAMEAKDHAIAWRENMGAEAANAGASSQTLSSYRTFVIVETLLSDHILNLNRELDEVSEKMESLPDRSIVRPPTASTVPANRNFTIPMILAILGSAYILSVFLLLRRTHTIDKFG